MREILADAPDDTTLTQLYLDHPEFRRHCDRCVELNGIDPEWVSPLLMRWLLFPADGETPAPLVALNSPYPAKHPPLLGGEPLTTRVELLAALAGVCDGNMADAVALANSAPARDLLAAMQSRAWALASQEEKDRAVLSQKKREMAEARGLNRG